MIRNNFRLVKFSWLFLCLFILILQSCKKQTDFFSEESDELFFARHTTESGAIKSNNYQSSFPNNDIIDSIINVLKRKDKEYKFSNKVTQKFGTPKWDYHLQIKNSNGGKTIIVPIFNEKNKKVDLLLFLYGNTKNAYKVKFVVRKSKQSKLKKTGDKDGKAFSELTLVGLFDSFEKNIANNSAQGNNAEVIKNKSNGVTVHTYCWYYTWSDGMSMGISNTQCSYRIVFTPEAYDQIDGGGGWGLPEFDLNIGGGTGDPGNPELTEEQKLEALLNCSCNCPEDETWLHAEAVFEPKWGQLGDIRTLNLELSKVGIDASSFSSLSLRGQFDKLSSHFFANRNFKQDASLGYVDADGSKKVDRYFYTLNKGWIDMHHFFYAAYLADKYGPTLASTFTTWAEFGQLGGWSFGNKSGFSYEDMASNSAGIEFLKQYKSAINNGSIDLRTAINMYFSGQGITAPSNAPNYHFIPHILDGNVPQAITPLGLKGEYLFNEAYTAYCKKDPATKEKIKKAHKVIHHSSNN